MVVTAENLKATADRLREALDAYHRLVDGWPYESETVPAEVREYLADRDGYASETDTSPAAALAAKVKELYYEAREVEASYVEQARRQDHPDWFAVIVATKPVREVARQVHAAGYGVDSETGEARYLLPPDLCPAHLVSMNDGSTPVTYADRVAQYRAVGDHFDLAPDVVYHPGSGHDVSPSAAFPESRVVYVDVDEAAMDDLARAGYEAVGADATGHELRRAPTSSCSETPGWSRRLSWTRTCVPAAGSSPTTIWSRPVTWREWIRWNSSELSQTTGRGVPTGRYGPIGRVSLRRRTDGQLVT
ncbi:hypothetical protein ACFQL4_03535 [Halosimplex aquaticum]